MSNELEEARKIISELYNVNDHLDSLASQIKSFDKNWFESSCDRPIVFGLMGTKEYIDQKLHELKLQLDKLDKQA